jgi:hypothetical protein
MKRTKDRKPNPREAEIALNIAAPFSSETKNGLTAKNESVTGIITHTHHQYTHNTRAEARRGAQRQVAQDEKG